MDSLLKLTRAHTVPLEAVPATVGALLATGGSLTWGVAFWLLFGVGYHLVGYAHNSWADWKNGYDKDDPHKQHHPLNTGELDGPWTGFFVGVSALLLMFYGFYGTVTFGSPWVVSLLVLGATAAWMYNEKGKETKLKTIYITVAHSTVFMIPYFALEGEFNLSFFFALMTVAFWIIYQILISGEIKDFKTDEVNFIKDHSVVGSDGEKRPSGSVVILGVVIRSTIGLLALTAASLYGARWDTMMIIIGVTVVSAGLSKMMVQEEYNRRDEAVETMALIEITSLFTFLLATSPAYGRLKGLVLLVCSVIWVLSMNRIMWDTSIKPDV